MISSSKAVLLAVLCAGFAVEAQPLPPPESANLALELKAKLMYLRADWGAASAINGGGLHQNGKSMDIGFLGGNVDAYFSEVPEALELARLHGSQKTLGLAFTTASLVLLLVDVGIMTSAAIRGGNALLDQVPLYFAIIGVSLGLDIAGLVFTVLAQTNLFRAVNTFNFGIIDRYLPAEQKIDFKLLLSHNLQGVGLSYRF
jgi:hypothetical protein